MKVGARFAWLVRPEAERHVFLARGRAQVAPEPFARIPGMTEAFPALLALLEQRGLSRARLRKGALGAAPEKTATVCPPEGPAPQPPAPPRRKRKGHGRQGARSCPGARRVPGSHPAVQTGDLCPAGEKGKLRCQPKPAPALRGEAPPPVTATGFEMEVLRCSLCGKTFTAPPPPQAALRSMPSLCSSPAASTRGRISRRCCASVPPTCLRRCKGARASRATSPKRARPFWAVAWRTGGVAWWKWPRTSPRSVVTSWRACAVLTSGTPKPKPKACPPRPGCTSPKPTAHR